MNVYIYQAALLCESCGESRKLACVGHEDHFDSGCYPQGPYDNGGGEADSPQHCDSCNAFLENPLTQEGVAYVLDRIRETKSGHDDNRVVLTWRRFYFL